MASDDFQKAAEALAQSVEDNKSRTKVAAISFIISSIVVIVIIFLIQSIPSREVKLTQMQLKSAERGAWLIVHYDIDNWEAAGGRRRNENAAAPNIHATIELKKQDGTDIPLGSLMDCDHSFYCVVPEETCRGCLDKKAAVFEGDIVEAIHDSFSLLVANLEDGTYTVRLIVDDREADFQAEKSLEFTIPLPQSMPTQ